MKTVLYAKEISCSHCTERIHKVLEKDNINHEIDLEKKLVTINGDETVVEQTIELLDDLGFTAIIQNELI